MAYKSFRTPFLSKPAGIPHQDENLPPPAKKRRISDAGSGNEPVTDDTKRARPQAEYQRPQSSSQPRKPLHTLIRPYSTQATPASSANSDSPEGYYNVLYRKITGKKHKTWEGDGKLIVRDGYATLQDESGRQMGKIPWGAALLPGSTLSIGSKDVEVESLMSKEEYISGRTFLGAVGKPTVRELDEQLRTNINFSSKRKKKEGKEGEEEEPLKPHIKVAAPSSQATQKQFKTPLLSNNVLPDSKDNVPVPRHDPTAPDALVMKQPTSASKGKQIVDVVVDPIISKSLREHQREGVKFMYECVMGMRPDSGEGAILADEMGLGKSLQVIALLWTLLKQNPIYEAKPVIKKAVIVCPATLTNNWKKEIRKWLGTERIGVFVADDKSRLTDFTKGRSYSVMIIGYERLRSVQDDLQKAPDIDIVIADEGHRLKTAKNKAAEAIKKLPTEKRIILSGTPLQNDLSELYFVVDLVNPGLLGKYNLFKREFETPIVKSRQPGASPKDVEKGEGRNAQLMKLTRPFILRRTADILSKYLPSKTEHILFCRPTSAQASVYRKVLESPVFNAVLRSPEASFQLITVLKKLCNSPSLLRAKEESPEESVNGTVASLVSSIPQSLLKTPGASGKLQVLDSLLHRLRTTTEEKVVIVSHYTATLDILGNLLTSLDHKFLRLDGSTPSSKRQDLVDKFNRTDAATCFAFLLSAKSGGAGLNLIGASRLILYDVDWNPSIELQAMARIHRDGQKRPCKIYRLLTQGALDEKIYQRQLTKMSLADSIVDNKTSASTFSREELRDLFALDDSAECQTHELLGCGCRGCGSTPATTAPSPAAVVEITDDESENDVLPSLPQLLKGPTQAQIDAVEARIQEDARKGKTKMSSLMQYQHLETARLTGRCGGGGAAEGESDGDGGKVTEEDAELLLDDDVLLHVLKDAESRVSFVFTKTSA